MADAAKRLREAIEQFKSEHGDSEEFKDVLGELDDVTKALSSPDEGEKETPGRKAAREADEEHNPFVKKDNAPGADFDNPPKPSGEGRLEEEGGEKDFSDHPLFKKAKERRGR